MEQKRNLTTADRAVEEESRRTRRLQVAVSLAMNIISQGDLTLEEASELVAATKRIALGLFPDKEAAFDLIYKPRLQRLIVEKFRLH